MLNRGFRALLLRQYAALELVQNRSSSIDASAAASAAVGPPGCLHQHVTSRSWLGSTADCSSSFDNNYSSSSSSNSSSCKINSVSSSSKRSDARSWNLASSFVQQQQQHHHQQQQQQQQQQQRCYHAAHGIPPMHGTTVLCVRRDGQVVMMADGQISSGSKIVKPNARKLRRLATEPVPSLGGFAGSTADALTLFERLEQRLEEHPGQLRRSAVELAKAWRQDRVLRHLEATMIIADATTCLEVSGNGELLEPADGVHAIGSGSRFAIAAARALMTVPGLSALEIARRAMQIAADKCVYTNDCFLWEMIGEDGQLHSSSSTSSSSQ